MVMVINLQEWVHQSMHSLMPHAGQALPRPERQQTTGANTPRAQTSPAPTPNLLGHGAGGARGAQCTEQAAQRAGPRRRLALSRCASGP